MSLSLILSFAITIAIWALLRSKTMSVGLMSILLPIAMITVILGAPNVVFAIENGYDGDSYWTLKTGGRIGVALISTFSLTALFTLLGLKSRVFRRLPMNVGLPLDIFIGLVTFAVTYAISPQIYYTLYQFIFPNLPNQIVVKRLLDFERIIQIAQFSPNGSMSDHLAGIAFWAVLPFTIWMHAQRKT